MPEESVVLLENGALFLFDLASYVNCQKLNGYIKGSKLRVLWDDSSCAKNYKWMYIEINWHPRILVVTQSDVALLLDFRHDECNVICLDKIEMLSPYAVVDEDQSLVFPRVGVDGFQFVLASQSLLLLCDMHKTVVPMLRWAHDLDNPCFNDVIRLVSSRKIEAQRYCASWNLVQNFDVANGEPLFYFEDNLLYSSVGNEYEFPKRFKYLNFDYLRGYLKKSHNGFQQKESFNLDFHKILYEKLKGMAGGKLVVTPVENLGFYLEDATIVKNTCFYGAMGGQNFVRGKVGQRFTVRNSLAQVVVEGSSDYCCEYMTSGCVVVLGKVGRNVVAEMTGVLTYMFDEDDTLIPK
ncbi:hypothetical protein Goklo_021508, partial [Gossypium klotzschianum]|nr:hypothetical protein [Gossypium klotzschianum]